MKEKQKKRNPGGVEKKNMNKNQETKQTDLDRELEKLLASHKTVIKVFGSGGAGNNTITRLMQVGIDGVETFAVNTDAQDLLFARANRKVLIGRNITNGLGAGSDPKIGEDSARENQDEVKELMAKTDLVFVTCGLGGGTGTGSAPVIAELARQSGALTISIVTLPFSEEGVLRWNNAQFGLERLRKNSDTLIVIQNDKLWEIAPEAPLDDAFKVADEVLVNAVKGITELVTQKGLVNLDFADIRTIMKDGGTALIGMAESESPERAIEAVEHAVENPLIDLNINGARSALLNITGGKDISIKDAKIAMQTLANKLDKSAKIIWGARVNPEADKKVRVMVIATGLQDNIADRLFRGEKKITEQSQQTKPKGTPETKPGSEASEPQPAETDEKEEAPQKPFKGESKKIFREIMEEESDADLKTISDLVTNLYDSIQDKDKWEELRQTCSSLTGTAQMFDFDEIAELMTAVEDMVSQVQGKEFFIEPVLRPIEELPDNVREMILSEHEATDWSVSFKRNINETADFLKSKTVVSVEKFQEHLEKNWGKGTQKPKEKQKKEKKLLPVSDENGDQIDNGNTKTRFSPVNDVVKYVDNLLRGENKSQK